MFELIGVPPQALFGQLLLGLINGAFYALLSLGLAVIFGLMNVINFTHGAQYMMGAFCSWMLLTYLGIPFWGALLISIISWILSAFFRGSDGRIHVLTHHTQIKHVEGRVIEAGDIRK